MVEENGFLKYTSDTLYNLTVINEYFHSDSQVRVLHPHQALTDMVEYNRQSNEMMSSAIKIDTGIIYSNGLAYPYCIKADSECCRGPMGDTKTVFITRVHALTCFNNSFIRFDFDNTLKKSVDSIFIRECLEAIKTIRIEKYSK